MAQLRVVRAEGDPYARGEHIGRELRDLVNESVDFYHRYLSRRGVSSEQLQELLTPYLAATETRLPASMRVLQGMSVGAMVPILELFAINAFEELEPLLQAPEGGMLFLQRKEGYVTPPTFPTERCTSFAITTPDGTILAHNEHWLAGDGGNVAVILDAPSDRPVRVASPTVVCCLPAVGLNSHRGAQGIASLTAADDRVGVPRVFTSRHSLDSMDRADAVARAGIPGRAGGYGHTFAYSGGQTFVVETTAEKIAVLEEPAAHTNHYLHPDLVPLGAEPSPGSSARLGRLHALLREQPPRDVEGVMQILRDHENSPRSICLHADPDEGDEADAVLFSMVTELEAGRMWIAPGTPCQTEYEEIDLTGLF